MFVCVYGHFARGGATRVLAFWSSKNYVLKGLVSFLDVLLGVLDACVVLAHTLPPQPPGKTEMFAPPPPTNWKFS